MGLCAWSSREESTRTAANGYGTISNSASPSRPSLSLLHWAPQSQTRGLEVFWYGIDVMDGALSSPGKFEQVRERG